MKIQCDVCSETEASVYCVADEASLCSVCDERVHHANMLAGKHARFSLQHPSPKDSPFCDICQEKKAFLFCQQDRAILCRDCDASIHKVNQHTKNHNRFLLTGVKLSPTASLYSSSTTQITQNGVVPDQQQQQQQQKQQRQLKQQQQQQQQQQKQVVSQIMNQTSLKTTNCNQEVNGSGIGSSTSSISEYLIETLPGWHVEDFLDLPTNFSKFGDNYPAPIWDGDLLDGNMNNSILSESMGIWVPQAPPPAAVAPPLRYSHVNVHQQYKPVSNMGFGDQITNGSSLEFGSNNLNKVTNGTKSSRKWSPDNGNCFTVPQISPPTTNSKRSRVLWH